MIVFSCKAFFELGKKNRFFQVYLAKKYQIPELKALKYDSYLFTLERCNYFKYPDGMDWLTKGSSAIIQTAALSYRDSPPTLDFLSKLFEANQI